MQSHPSMRRFVIQHATGFSSADHMMHKRGLGTANCPFCGQNKTEAHLFHCMEARSKKTRHETVKTLRKRLYNLKTPPVLLETILQALLGHQRLSFAVDGPCTTEILFGFVPVSWRLQFDAVKTDQRVQSMPWCAKVIAALWTATKVILQFRVNSLLEKEHRERQKREEGDIDASI